MIPLSFAQIYTELQNFIQDTSSGTLTIIKDEINLEYEKIATGINWPELVGYLDESATFSAGVAYLALPGDCATVIQILDKDNDIILRNKSLPQLLKDNLPWMANSTTPYFYSELGIKPIKRPLSAADMVEALSSAAGDTTQSLRISGLRSDKLIQQVETIALNGTTVVSGATTYRIGWSIESIGTNGSPTGVVTIREKTSDTELADIPIGQQASRYFIVLLEAPSTAASNLNIVYKKRITKLTNDNDVPIIPVGHYLVEKVKEKLRQYDKKYIQANAHKAAANESIGAVLSEKRLQPDRVRQARATGLGRIRRGY